VAVSAFDVQTGLQHGLGHCSERPFRFKQVSLREAMARKRRYQGNVTPTKALEDSRARKFILIVRQPRELPENLVHLLPCLLTSRRFQISHLRFHV
jgi:hypothetical protein